MDKDMRLADNIRCLREAYGETQTDVAFAIGVEKNTISNYECGVRSPKPSTLAKIASHFLVSVEELMKSDFSECAKADPNPKIVSQSYRFMFPIVSSDEALKDLAFQKGLHAHKALYECLSTENPDEDQVGDLMDKAMEQYVEAFEGPAEKEAIANWMGMWCLFHLSAFVVPEVVDAEAAPIELLRKKDHKLDQGIYDYLAEREDDPDWDKDLAELKEATTDPEMQEMLTEMLKVLRESEEYRDTADFYLAMQYFCGVVQNGLSLELNRRVGFEMVHAFARMGNRMARRLLRFLRNAWTPKRK